MAYTIDVAELKHLTDDYHRLLSASKKKRGLVNKRYLEDAGTGYSLLEMEMAHLAANGALPDPGDRTTLVILVGERFEPLLQSIWAHRPVRLIPVVNRYYGNIDDEDSSQDTWEKLYAQITKLPAGIRERISNLNDIQDVKPVSDNPTTVFERLQVELAEDLLDPGVRVVVDITGAKKPMVAGAFMLAAYAQADIYYIDPQYFSDRGYPYGYKSVFRKVTSPIEALGLDIWEEVIQAYESYNFAVALKGLGLLVGKLSSRKQLADKIDPLVAPSEQLETYLNVCSDWENGRLRSAYETAKGLAEPVQKLVPTAVQQLQSYWPGFDDRGYDLDFFDDADAVAVYAEDELQRITRLRQDSQVRQAYSRAFALLETLFKARIAVLQKAGALIIRKQKAAENQEVNKDKAATLFLKALNQNLYPTCRLLVDGQMSIKKYKLVWDMEQWPVRLPQELDLRSEQNEEIRTIRNLATHSYFPIVDSDLLTTVIALAEQSLDDYCQNWSGLPAAGDAVSRTRVQAEGRFACPDWKTLKQTCGLSYIPERNITKEEEGA